MKVDRPSPASVTTERHSSVAPGPSRDETTARPTDPLAPRAELLGTASAFPERWCSQAEILARFGYRDDPVARRMFLHNGMEGRFLALPPEAFADTVRPGFQQRVFQRAAIDLAEASVRRLLSEHPIPLDRIGGLVTTTTYGFVVPPLSAQLAQRLGLRSDLRRLDITGAGCVGSITLLDAAQRCLDPGRDEHVIAVSTEVGSLFMRDWPAEDRGSMVINALMGDASVATLLASPGPSRAVPRPRLLDTQYASDWDTIGEVDIRLGPDGTMSGHIHRSVPSIAARLYQRAAAELLARHDLQRDDIRWWALHPGSRVVIEAVQDALGLHDHELATSRQVLRDYGNVGSATALLCLHEQLQRGHACVGDYGILGGVGPGMTVGLTLFQFA